jgi:hypothetical protein
VIKSDTDGNGKLTPEDKCCMVLTGPDGKNPKEVITDADVFLESIQTDPKTVMILYENEGATKAALFSIEDGTIDSSVEISGIFQSKTTK